ncbi:MAG TPA: hypothetical protein VEZ20_14345 [Allosphingosinicella sp.]|nr:hypothetical protein [Allosphingosinicella sp.]
MYSELAQFFNPHLSTGNAAGSSIGAVLDQDLGRRQQLIAASENLLAIWTVDDRGFLRMASGASCCGGGIGALLKGANAVDQHLERLRLVEEKPVLDHIPIIVGTNLPCLAARHQPQTAGDRTAVIDRFPLRILLREKPLKVATLEIAALERAGAEQAVSEMSPLSRDEPKGLVRKRLSGQDGTVP